MKKILLMLVLLLTTTFTFANNGGGDDKKDSGTTITLKSPVPINVSESVQVKPQVDVTFSNGSAKVTGGGVNVRIEFGKKRGS